MKLKKCPPRVITDLVSDAGGEGVTVEITQAPGDLGGWTIDLFAFMGTRRVRMQQLAVTAPIPTRTPNRILFVGGTPGASGFGATVRPPAGGNTYLKVALHASKQLVTPTVVST
jgi:hypothetical protein